MILAIMQPYFFPYLGYFSLINNSDEFLILDETQFIRHGWIERNRILKPKEGWQYIKVPLKKHSRNVSIKDIRIDNEKEWASLILRQLYHYKKIAKHYDSIIRFLENCFSERFEHISDLNIFILKSLCNFLGIRDNIKKVSDYNINNENNIEPDDWALNISLSMNATVYINPPNGVFFFNREKFSRNGIEIRFIKNKLEPYYQNREVFESGLSIIDVMMFNSKDEIIQMLNLIEMI